ncbi:MAG: PQQ-dependent sugar dehydrogenase [Acidobacteriota bacterium]
MIILRNLAAVVLAVAFLVFTGFAQGVPAPYTVRLQPFMSGLDRPILYRDDGLGAGRKTFIVQQTGLIRLLQPGSRTPTDFINLSSKIPAIGGLGDERGLLGMTVHRLFDTNGKFYVNYTRAADGATVIAEYKTVTGNPNQGDINSERILLIIPQPFSNHNGGMVEFGSTPADQDFLYIGMGDGGSSNDPGNRAQNRTQLLGKMLRIDPNVADGSPVPYVIPPGNPFQGANTTRCDGGSTTAGNTCQEIWTIGMRNPWRWSFDRMNGNLWAADVGQFSVEEVDMITPGTNYGWRVFEGTSCTGNDSMLCTTPPPGVTYTPPVFEYSSASPSVRCSITGGYVYRGTQRSLPSGGYVFSDYCTAEIMLYSGSLPFQVLLDPAGNIISFGQDENNELYACFGTSISRITRAKATADFDGDLRTDLSVFRPSTGVWYVAHSSNGTFRIQQFGVDSDIPTSEDFDGDNISDIGVFRPSTGVWYFQRSSDNTVVVVPFGTNGDVPAAGDYDGDAKADLVVYRPSSGTWWVLPTLLGSAYQLQFGLNGDTPVVGDYDGDGKSDIAVWRGSTGVWYRINSSDGSVGSYQFGVTGDIPTQADFDGDGRTDVAIFRPTTGLWYIVRSVTGAVSITQWGTNGDQPVVGDYDGDGLDDIAVFRPSNGTWYRISSLNGSNVFTQFGSTGDLAIPRYDAP